MDNFLNKYHLPKLNQDQISKLNTPKTAKEIETVIKVSQPEKTQGKTVSMKFSKYFKELITTLLKMFHTIETEGALPNSFYKAIITLIPKPHKNILKRRIRDQSYS